MSIRAVLLFLVTGWLILILQSTVVSYLGLGVQPELLIILLVHCGVHRQNADGVILAICYGYLMDLFSGYPFGTYLFIYLALYFVARLLSVRLLLQSRPAQLAMVAGFTFLGGLVLALLNQLTAPLRPGGPSLSDTLLRTVLNAIIVLCLFPVLSWLERRVRVQAESLQYR